MTRTRASETSSSRCCSRGVIFWDLQGTRITIPVSDIVTVDRLRAVTRSVAPGVENPSFSTRQTTRTPDLETSRVSSANYICLIPAV